MSPIGGSTVAMQRYLRISFDSSSPNLADQNGHLATMDGAINYGFTPELADQRYFINNSLICKVPRPQQQDKEISLAWKNLRFEVKPFGLGAPKPILRRLNGHFQANSLNGLMGPSGAGKTTLLNCLSGNDKSGLTKESEIYLSAKEKSPITYFIDQHVHESIVGRMSVGDILSYAFRFKNPSSCAEQMEQHIQRTIKELMLPVDILERNFENCSGGEQKRIAIGQELMSLQKPSFLFIDEPTTGLDSSAAVEVMKCLRQLTTSYRITVIASLHLPSHETLSLLDKLYVLAKGGVCIYSGPPSNIQSFLEYEIQHKIPKDQPPVEALIRVACEGVQNQKVSLLAQKCLVSEFETLSTHKQSELTYQPYGLPINRKQFNLSNFLLQLLRLLQITFRSDCRILVANIVLIIAFYSIMATMFNRQMARPNACVTRTDLPSANASTGQTCAAAEIYENSLVMENICFLSYSFMVVGYLLICSSAQFFLPLVKVFRNEHRNHWYSTGVFYWSSLLLSLLQVLLLTLLISTISYFLTNQHIPDQYTINWHRFLQYSSIIFLLCIYMESIGKLIGTVLLDYVKLAIVFCQILYSFMCMLNGFYIEIDDTGNEAIIGSANVIAIRYLTKNMIHTIYGINRCDWSRQYSWIMFNNHVESSELLYNYTRVFINIAIVQLVTLIFMYCKFNTFHDHPLMKLIKKCREESETIESPLIPLEIGDNVIVDLSTIAKSDSFTRAKDVQEMKYEEFLHDKIAIAWKNLSLYGASSFYEIGGSRDPKMILRNLNGAFRFGSLNALMGTSGAGKTSLLKVLNGRLKTRVGAESEFYLSRYAKIETCFITQEVSSHLMPGLTAKQSLIYASRMKNTESGLDHEKIAVGVLAKLDLLDTVDTRVDRCSGGERKRLALGLELTSLRMPNLICIDEPTSGLDSNSAEIVISCLHKLTRAHSLQIIASIHQPNTEILSQFDQLYVLARGGVCIYTGPPSGIESHLRSIEPVPESQFAIEELIKHSCSNHDEPLVQQLVAAQVELSPDQLEAHTQLVADGVVHNRARFSLHSVHILSARYLAYIRGFLWFPTLFYVVNFLLFSYTLNSIFDPRIAEPSGCVSVDHDQSGACHTTSGAASSTAEQVLEIKLMTNNYRYSFYLTSVTMFNLVLNSALQFAQEFEYLKNEHRNGWYSSGSFYLVKCIFETVPTIPLMAAHVYIVNIYEQARPGLFWPMFGLFMLTAIALHGMSHALALLSRGNLLILTSMSVFVYVAFTIIGNFFLSLSNLHYIYQFGANFSIPRFIFEAFMLLQYGFGRCAPRQLQSILHIMNITDEDFVHCVLMLAANLLLYRLLACYLLVRRLNPVENRRARVQRIVQHHRALLLNQSTPIKAAMPPQSNSSN